MYIERQLEATLKSYLDKPEIIALVGPRQCGKTTLLKHLQSKIPNSVYLSFEDRQFLELFELDIKKFAQQYLHYEVIFIDEFQYSQSGGKHLKYLFDTFPGKKMIISGSSAIDLTVKTVKYLVGRIFIFQLHQLNFAEFLAWKNHGLYESYYLELKKKYHLDFKKMNLFERVIKITPIPDTVKTQFKDYLEEFIIWGGYPRVVLCQTAAEKEQVLKNIHSTYFLREVRDILGLIDDFKLSNLVHAMALQIGNLIQYKELGTIAHYDYVTLKKYLNFLEKTFIIKLIRPYFRNKRTEIVKNPKVYLYDTGLRNVMVNDFRRLLDRNDKGSLYENFVLTECMKYERELQFWRTQSKSEVDFIYEKEGTVLPMECKSTIREGDIPTGLFSFFNAMSVRAGIILNEEQFNSLEKDSKIVHYLPYWLL